MRFERSEASTRTQEAVVSHGITSGALLGRNLSLSWNEAISFPTRSSAVPASTRNSSGKPPAVYPSLPICQSNGASTT